MNRSRALVVSLAVAIAAIAGVFAVAKTATLGAQTRSTSDAQIARRTAQLDRYEASLQQALTKQPPPLPAVPPASQASSAVQSALPAKVVYHRPSPVVVVTHRGGDDEGEHGDEHEDEHEFGGAEADD